MHLVGWKVLYFDSKFIKNDDMSATVQMTTEQAHAISWTNADLDSWLCCFCVFLWFCYVSVEVCMAIDVELHEMIIIQTDIFERSMDHLCVHAMT